MEGRRRQQQAQRVPVRVATVLTSALALALALGTASAVSAIGPSVAGPGILPDVGCNPATGICTNESKSGGGGGSGGGTKPKPKGNTTCTATDPTTGKKVTGPITSQPVEPQPPPKSEGGPGQWKWIFCGGVRLPNPAWISSPASTGAQQIKLITFPHPTIHMSPDPAKADQVVGWTTWLWVEQKDFDAIHNETNAPPVHTVADLTASQSVTWDMGDGSPPFTCQGPGQPWARGATPGPGTCTYTFKNSSAGKTAKSGQTNAFTVTATITWSGSWVDNIGGGGPLGPLPMSSSVPVRVSEVQSINNG
jgi:hypothetical protein